MKLVIPTLLAVTAIIAAVFAFVPVDQASAVHTTLLANIEDQDRAFSLMVDSGPDAEADLTVITLGATDDFNAEGILSSSGTGACVLDDASGTDLITGTVDDAVAATFQAGTTAGFALGEDLVLDAVPANTQCNLFIHVMEWE